MVILYDIENVGFLNMPVLSERMRENDKVEVAEDEVKQIVHLSEGQQIDLWLKHTSVFMRLPTEPQTVPE